MFQTFTGSSRRPRNVNLSGRTNNPFASVQQSHRPGQSSSPGAVAQAQQERRARQNEREKTQAAKTLQRVWKGYSTRRDIASQLRSKWDEGDSEAGGSDDLNKELRRLKLLVRFVDRRNEEDIRRVARFAIWLREWTQSFHHLDGRWKGPLGRLAHWTSRLMAASPEGSLILQRDLQHTLLGFLATVSRLFPDEIAPFAEDYYDALGVLFQSVLSAQTLLIDAIAAPLAVPASYEGFVTNLLTTTNLQEYIDLKELARRLDSTILIETTHRLSRPEPGSRLLGEQHSLLWFTAYFIFFHDSSPSNRGSRTNIAFTDSISSLLSHLTSILGQAPDIHNTQTQQEVPKFVQDQLSKLIDKEGIQELLSSFQGPASDSDSAAIANYVLILLRVFPRRGDDIRMWLYMGSMVNDQGRPEPAIKFFWKAVRSTKIYQDIYDEHSKAIELLHNKDRNQRSHVQGEWRKILLFLELYTFVLKVMDDEEFMNGSHETSSKQSWTRRSALPISEVTHLTVFLKNLAFAMYWHSRVLEPTETVDSSRIVSYFSNSNPTPKAKARPASPQDLEETDLAGIHGITLKYIKGMVTGLLRMLYERDSRRDFTRDKNHWLMDSIKMDGFINAVVEEQAQKSKFQDDSSEEEQEHTDDDEMDQGPSDSLIGTGRAQQVRRIERLKAQQQKEAKRKQLRNVTPRLEILQNMPFLIPFATRVEIFRRFVFNDQVERRGGTTLVDPDLWRMAQQHGRSGMSELGKHAAKVRREHIFDDAYDRFYGLGEGLKEPIQITFVDRFDSVEAGIDGGGVTKEFLTSITNEAFSPDHDFNLFIENSQHLLYPNPSAMDEKKELLRDAMISEGSKDWISELKDLTNRYEFLGRVVGKCLYEGILVDIHFAPFFLVKWALTGGSGAATNESGYRANINDLRDLDEELYQGLLKLKNHPANVDDFSLDFTVTDMIARSPHEKFVTKDLRPGGSSIPVTNENRLIYISSIARHRLQLQPARQTQAFLRGLGSIIQPSWLSMFNQSELQTLLGGDESEIDVEDLRANTLYGGVYQIGDDGQEHPTVKSFWAVMHELSDKERRTVLKYVTSTPRGPLLGFGLLNPRFSIRDSGGDQDRLPSTSTCVNLLKLPIYRDIDVLREKLLYAAQSGAGFDLS